MKLRGVVFGLILFGIVAIPVVLVSARTLGFYNLDVRWLIVGFLIVSTAYLFSRKEGKALRILIIGIISFIIFGFLMGSLEVVLFFMIFLPPLVLLAVLVYFFNRKKEKKEKNLRKLVHRV